MATDMKNGWTSASPVRGANNPFRTICNRNGGASGEFCGAGGDRRTATTTRTGMPASAAASSQVRHRRTCFESSTRYIDALHEVEEDVLERVALRLERVDADPATHERVVHVGGSRSVGERDVEDAGTAGVRRRHRNIRPPREKRPSRVRIVDRDADLV